MKTVYSEEFYKKNRSRFEGKRLAIKPEKDLAWKVDPVRGKIPEEAIKIVETVFAQEIIKRYEQELMKEFEAYKKVIRDHGECLGYTTIQQQLSASQEIIQFFEFNCMKLAEFKKQYRMV